VRLSLCSHPACYRGGMATDPTTGDLYKAKAVSSDEIDAAVDAILARPDVGAYPIGGGYLGQAGSNDFEGS
jgi:hypothetical protein